MFKFIFEIQGNSKLERIYIDAVDNNEAVKGVIKQYGPILFEMIDVQDLDVLDENLDEIEDFVA